MSNDQKGSQRLDLDVRQFAKHVNKVGPERAFLDFIYGLFVVADEVLKTGVNGKSYPKPFPPKENKK